jgi:hypothetical protein
VTAASSLASAFLRLPPQLPPQPPSALLPLPLHVPPVRSGMKASLLAPPQRVEGRVPRVSATEEATCQRRLVCENAAQEEGFS